MPWTGGQMRRDSLSAAWRMGRAEASAEVITGDETRPEEMAVVISERRAE